VQDQGLWVALLLLLRKAEEAAAAPAAAGDDAAAAATGDSWWLQLASTLCAKVRIGLVGWWHVCERRPPLPAVAWVVHVQQAVVAWVTPAVCGGWWHALAAEENT
jgi:hypothetical protein